MQDTWRTVKSGDFQFSLDETEVNILLDIQINLHICHWNIIIIILATLTDRV